MINRRKALTFSTLAMTSLLLFQFQNCAPPNSASTGTGATGGDARIVDDFSKSEIQFVSTDVQVHDEALLTEIDGLCNRSHNNAKLKWAVYGGDNESKPLVTGETKCQRGQFGVELAGLSDMVCGLKHLIVVEGDWGASTFTHLSRRCQPLAAEVVAAPQNSPAGTTCSLEYQASTEFGSNCNQVCYRGDKMVMNFPVASAQCSGIAAKLAGP